MQGCFDGNFSGNLYKLVVYLFVFVSMKEKKLIAFDMYDTRVTAPQWPNPYKGIFSQLWIEWQFYKDLAYIVQTTDADIAEILQKNKAAKISDALLSKFQSDMDAQLSSLSLYDDFLPTIDILKTLWYETAVVSNLSKPYSYPLTNLVSKDMFDYKILSYEVGMQKPDRKIFDHLKDISWYSSDEIVMVGDSLKSDVQWAKNSGIQPIHIDRSSNGLVYHADYISISTLKQLLEILEIKKS